MWGILRLDFIEKENNKKKMSFKKRKYRVFKRYINGKGDGIDVIIFILL